VECGKSTPGTCLSNSKGLSRALATCAPAWERSVPCARQELADNREACGDARDATPGVAAPGLVIIERTGPRMRRHTPYHL
jgi:hypothetical protein